MARGHDLGRAGEALAARLLEERGWRIVARNFRFGHRELDLVARRGSQVAFVEVKTRRSETWGHPLAAVDWRKRADLERVARFWIERHGRRGDHYRFDAVSVLWRRGARPVTDHIEDAWRV